MLIWSESDINLVAKATYHQKKKKDQGDCGPASKYWLMVNAAGFSVLMQQKMKSQREEKAAAARN